VRRRNDSDDVLLSPARHRYLLLPLILPFFIQMMINQYGRR